MEEVRRNFMDLSNIYIDTDESSESSDSSEIDLIYDDSSSDSSDIALLNCESDDDDGGTPNPTPQQPQKESGNGGNKESVKKEEGPSRGGTNNEASSAAPSLSPAPKLQQKLPYKNGDNKSSQGDALYSPLRKTLRRRVRFDLSKNDDEDKNKKAEKRNEKLPGHPVVPRRSRSRSSSSNNNSSPSPSPLLEKKPFIVDDTLLKALNSSLVGQDFAIRAVNSAMMRKLNMWVDDKHPMVFLFLGSSGIGKTELAKETANYLCHRKKPEVNAFIRIDMSEYQEKHSVAKFIGAPPGYIGHENGGQLTNTLKKNKKVMVLFDEVDKAHPDILTILLQLFDEGRLTDSKGETVIVKDSIFVMTSNLGSEEISEHVLQLRKESKEKAKYGLTENLGERVEEKIVLSSNFEQEVIRKILKAHFKWDAFLGRINDIIYFFPFSSRQINQLVDKELKFWVDKAKRTHGIKLLWYGSTLVEALSQGYNIHYGARSIKHYIEKVIVNPLAEAEEEGLIKNHSGQQVLIDAIAYWNKAIYWDQGPFDYSIMLSVKEAGECEFRLISSKKHVL